MWSLLNEESAGDFEAWFLAKVLSLQVGISGCESAGNCGDIKVTMGEQHFLQESHWTQWVIAHWYVRLQEANELGISWDANRDLPTPWC